MTSSKRENQTNSGWFHQRTEGVMIINGLIVIRFLWEPASCMIVCGALPFWK